MIVKEEINFEKNPDPLASMGLGLKPQMVEFRKEVKKMIMDYRAKSNSSSMYSVGAYEALEDVLILIDKLPIMQ